MNKKEAIMALRGSLRSDDPMPREDTHDVIRQLEMCLSMVDLAHLCLDTMERRYKSYTPGPCGGKYTLGWIEAARKACDAVNVPNVYAQFIYLAIGSWANDVVEWCRIVDPLATRQFEERIL